MFSKTRDGLSMVWAERESVFMVRSSVTMRSVCDFFIIVLINQMG